MYILILHTLMLLCSRSNCKIGAAQCLGELYRLFGHRITSGLIETTNIAAKLMKFHEVI